MFSWRAVYQLSFSSLIAQKLQPLSSNSYMDSSLTASRFLTKVVSVKDGKFFIFCHFGTESLFHPFWKHERT